LAKEEIEMANDPKDISNVNREYFVDDDDTVVDPDLQPYDESIEKPIEDSQNFIPAEEL
jgi:hypothetical protein